MAEEAGSRSGQLSGLHALFCMPYFACRWRWRVGTRKAVTDGWFNIADALDIQRETTLANEVRDFARHLPRV